MFWKKKNKLTIQCPKCEWRPDGKAYWQCSCDHTWDTFKTAGKCPKCSKQWETTYCPGCGDSPNHKDWYFTKEQLQLIEDSGDPALRAKKKWIERQLNDYGIKTRRISHVPYLDHKVENYRSASEAGIRMIILSAVSWTVHDLDFRAGIIKWLKEEKLWDHVSANERSFLLSESPDERMKIDMSWCIEDAYVLGWCLNKVKYLSRVDFKNDKAQEDEFVENLPAFGEPLGSYLHNLELRDLAEIHRENLLNELISSHFRDLHMSGEKDKTKIDVAVSFQRHRTLNWLRRFMDVEDWDETLTST
jgi:hypothetical protein